MSREQVLRKDIGYQWQSRESLHELLSSDGCTGILLEVKLRALAWREEAIGVKGVTIDGLVASSVLESDS